MKIRWGLLIMGFCLVSVAATNADRTSSGPSQKTKSNNSALGPQGIVSDSIVNFFSGRKTGKDLMAEKSKKGAKSAKTKARNSAKAGTPQEPSYSEVASGTEGVAKTYPPLSTSPMKTSPVIPRAYTVPKVYKPAGLAVPPPPVPQVAIPQIRQEIQKILELNNQIKAVQGGRAVQFQRVQEQARIHQQILNQIEASPENTKSSGKSKTPSKAALLAQEKLRIIHEETQRNTALLEAVSGGNAVEPVPATGSKPQKT